MAKDRKRKVQAQRKFAQGAYIPPSAERRTDTTPIKDTDHKRLAKNIIVNNVSAKNLLDVVSMHNLHTHGQPIVLVERMPGAPLNGVDKPLAVKTKETLEEPAMPVVNGHNETKEAKEIEHVAKCPKVPKKLKVSLKSSRDIMLLRSRSSKRRIIKKNEAKRVCTKKRPQPPSREATPKKKCTRNKSPGFSDDDDMPLNKITPTNNKDTSELERDDVPLNQINKTNTKVSKLLERDEVPMNKRTQINKTKVTKELEKDDLPLNKIAHINKTNSKVTKESEKGDVPTNKITHINSPNNKVSKQAGRDDVPANKITAINKITSKVANSSEKGNTPLNKTAHINKTHSKATKQVEKDDLPLSKMTNINKINSKVKEIDKEKRNESNEDVNKKQFCTLRSAVGRSSVEDPPLPAKPTEPPAKSKELKIDLIQLPPPKQTSKSMDKTTVSDSAANPIPKPENSESYYGRNMIERWLVDATTSPPEADAARAPPTAPSTPAAVPEPHHFKVPQLLIKRTKVKPPEPRPAVEPGPTPNKHVPPINKKRDPTPCPSEKFYAAKNVQTATKSDLDSFCKKCITCRKLSMFVNLKPEKRTATRRQEPSDVYAFDDSEPPKEQLLGYNPKRLKTKDNKNMYLDLPQNSAHIVKLVEVKMPNQVKPIMRARLVPKTEVSQGETSEKEPVAPKKNGEMPHIALPANSNNSTNTVETDVSGEKSAKVSDTKPLSSYAKAKEATESGNLSGSSNTDINSAKTVEAPTFYPTEAEFENPIAYLEKITGIASEFGLCKIVPPPGFKPECHLDETVRFTATNQYLGKMFTRWGPASRELCAIKTHLATQKVLFSRAPLIDSMEVNLPKLYHIVQRMGGLRKVIEKEKWSKVAEELNYQKGNLVEKKLDQVYVKYLLPYDTLTNRERQNILSKVDRDWNKRYKRMLERARSPLHKQRQQLGECASASASDSDEDDPPPDEADDCVLRGRPMSMLTFEKVAKSVMQMQFPGAPAAGPSPEAVEEAYWRLVVSGSDHVCVNTAAVDTGARGLGFTKNKLEPGAKHPWNLKVLSNSPGSVLRSLGAVLSVTVPTLHLGMVFSTSCWHRDPHGLPWLEYHHAGPPKIWYGIPDEQSDRFRGAVEALCPAYCQNKSIWLPSDITMIPPHLLNQRDVALSRLLQRPGEFVVIFPKAYSCSICTGYTISESVYYAPTSWLNTVQNDFQMVRDSFEPTMFSLEQLLIALASDSRVALPALRVVQKTLEAVVDDELARRRALRKRGIPVNEMKHPPKKKAAAWNVRELDECDICRTTLYLSKVSGLVDKRGAHCPQHALKVLQRERDAVDATLECFYSEDALQSVLAKLRRRLT